MSTKSNYKLKIVLSVVLSFLWVMWLVIPAKGYTSSTLILEQSGVDDPYRVEEFTIRTPGNLEVRTSGGHIEVDGSESNTVRVEMYVRQNGRELTPSDTDLDDFDIEIEQRGNTVTAIAKREGKNRWFGNNNISISFVVYTPREMSTRLKTSGGHIRVTGLEGNQDIRTSGGHLDLKQLLGTIEARTSGGHIEVADIEGKLNARTSGGHIEAMNSSGSIQLGTSGGHIRLDKIRGTVEARTSGGSITANLENIDQSVSLRTSGGHVSVTVPRGMGLELDLRGSSVRTELRNFSGEVERDEIVGTINGGGPKLTARTSGGWVRLNYR